MSEIQLTTPIEQLEMPDKLRTRLQLNRCMTFADVMAIKPSDWDNVAAKVVNALKRFQKSNYAIYRSLQPKPQHSGQQSRERAADERRFFVANNILNAYASAGKLFAADRPTAEVMAEIVEAADLFMTAFNSSNATEVEATPEPQQQPQPQQPQPAQPAMTVSDSPFVEPGMEILITEYKGKRGPKARNFKVGDKITIAAMKVKEETGVIEVRGSIDDKPVKFTSERYAWEEV